MQNKICFILPGWITKKTGGSELQLYHLSNKFVAEGWNVEVVTVKKPVQYKRYLNPKIKYYYYHQSYFGFSHVMAYFALLLKLFQTRSYYYYVRTDARIERAAVWIFTRITKRKYIFALAHDDDAKNLQFKERHPSKSKYFIKRLFAKVDSYLADLLSKKNNSADLIIVQNTFQQTFLQNKFKLSSSLIKNSYFDTFTDENQEKKSWVIWVGNMREFKQPIKFLQIVKNIPDSHFKFLMIGECRNFCNQINDFKQSNFEYLGAKTYEETLGYFSKAKVIINTSDKEGFSNTFLQAWANRVWLITLGVDPDHIISVNKIGDVLKTPEEAVDRIKEIETKGTDNRLLEKAQNIVKEQFSLDSNYNLLVQQLNNHNRA